MLWNVLYTNVVHVLDVHVVYGVRSVVYQIHAKKKYLQS